MSVVNFPMISGVSVRNAAGAINLVPVAPPSTTLSIFTEAGAGSAGYSFYKMGSYNGNCVKVRRASDNATLDVGFVSGYVDTSAISAHIASTTGWVDTWYDQSGAGLNLVQATTADQPQLLLDTNGYWYVNGVNGDFLRSATFIGAKTNSTMSIIWQATSNGSAPLATTFQGGVDFAAGNGDIFLPWWTVAQSPSWKGSGGTGCDWVDKKPRQHVAKWLNGTHSLFEYARPSRTSEAKANPTYARLTVGKVDAQNANVRFYELAFWPSDISEATLANVTKVNYSAFFNVGHLRIHMGDSNTAAGFVAPASQWTQKVYDGNAYTTPAYGIALGARTLQNAIDQFSDVQYYLQNMTYDQATVVCFLGTNDLIAGASTGAQALTKLKTLSQMIKAATAKPVSFVSPTMLPRTSGGWSSTERDAFNTALLADVSGDINVVVNTTTNANLQNQNNATYFVDTTHLSAAGHTELANMIVAAI